jgi:hypothetical protein
MGADLKEVRIFIRIQRERKEIWKDLCVKKEISLSSLIIDSVENRILDDERRNVLVFIEKQDKLFVKIETNINQIARIANTQKFINRADLQNLSNKLSEITELKIKQNEIFTKIYSLIANDH